MTTYVNPRYMHTKCPDCRADGCIPVEQIPEGRPDFEPGDRVRSMAGGDAEVLTYPQHVGSRDWWPMVVRTDSGSARVWDAASKGLTKLPREKTVVLRVTGPEKDVAEAEHRLAYSYESEHERVHSVRVERVDDE